MFLRARVQILLLVILLIVSSTVGSDFLKYFPSLFSKHKMQPTRSYTVYGSGGPMDVDAGLPKEFSNPPELTPEQLEQIQDFQRKSQLSKFSATNSNWRQPGGDQPFLSASFPPVAMTRPMTVYSGRTSLTQSDPSTQGQVFQQPPPPSMGIL